MKEFEKEIIQGLSLIDENSVNMTRIQIKKNLDKMMLIAKRENSEKWITFLESEWLYYIGQVEESYDLTWKAYELDKREAAEGNKQNYYILNSMAVSHYSLKEYERALGCYTKVIELNPEYYQAYVDSATVYRHIGKYDKALENIEKVLKKDNKDDIYYQALEAKGRLYMDLQKYREANQILTEIEAEKDKDAEYLEALALSYIYIKKYDSAQEYFSKALQICQDKKLQECLKMKLELTKFCSEIFDKEEMFNNPAARDMVLGLSLDRIQIMKSVFSSMKDQFSIGKRYCEKYKKERKERPNFYSQNYILCLKGWSSSTPEISLGLSNHSFKRGGGFYIKFKGIGVVIDPGINFFENLHENNLYVQDIDVVIVTHDHIDHNNDLKKILDMNYQVNNYQVNKKIIYYLDKETYSIHSKELENVEKRCREHVVKIFPDAPETERRKTIKIPEKKCKLMLEICQTDHMCEGSFGFKLILDNKIIGYTSDTKYNEQIGNFFKDCDIIITNISETNRDDLMLIKPKETHLGIYGVSNILKKMEKKKVLCLVTEFYGGFGDMRIEMTDIVREYVCNDKIDIVPVDIGMMYFFDDETFLCNNCEGRTNRNHRTIVRMGKEDKRILCLCENCSYR